MAKIKITYKKLDELAEYEGNPRRNDKAVEAVKNSIAKFGMVNPIIINGEGVILAGHTRLKALKEAGETESPVVVIDHLTEEQERAYRIADNRAGEFSAWDSDLLAEEIKAVQAEDWKAFGFSDKQLRALEPPEKCICPKCKKEFIFL